jgi:hypothetical protein
MNDFIYLADGYRDDEQPFTFLASRPSERGGPAPRSGVASVRPLA